MARCRLQELAVGSVDGVNRTFKTQTRDYFPGSVVPIINGQAWFGCATELGGKTFELPEAPIVGDVVSVSYVTLS